MICPPLAIYIHWPFCRSICPYCHFNRYVSTDIDSASWLQDYCQELSYWHKRTPQHHVVSIFFGGGTPSLMDPSLVKGVLSHIFSLWSTDLNLEITLEMNPDDVAKAQDFVQAGINRFSMGVQSFHAETLKLLGRHHTTQHLTQALGELKRLSARYSFDLIYGHAHHQSLHQWEEELHQAREWVSEHLSLYELSYESGTPFYRKRHHTLADEHLLNLESMTDRMLSPLGFYRYEVSNYALVGHHSVHNGMYWMYHEFLGIGPGAHGRLDTHGSNPLSTYNIGLPERWSNHVRHHHHGCVKETRLTREQRAQEQLLMGLRLSSGLPIHRLFDTDEQATPEFIHRLKHATEQGLIQSTPLPPSLSDISSCPILNRGTHSGTPSWRTISEHSTLTTDLSTLTHLSLTNQGRCVLNSVVDYLTKTPVVQQR